MLMFIDYWLVFTDINKQVLKEHSKALPVMMKLAEEKLRKVNTCEWIKSFPAYLYSNLEISTCTYIIY